MCKKREKNNLPPGKIPASPALPRYQMVHPLCCVITQDKYVSHVTMYSDQISNSSYGSSVIFLALFFFQRNLNDTKY